MIANANDLKDRMLTNLRAAQQQRDAEMERQRQAQGNGGGSQAAQPDALDTILRARSGAQPATSDDAGQVRALIQPDSTALGGAGGQLGATAPQDQDAIRASLMAEKMGIQPVDANGSVGLQQPSRPLGVGAGGQQQGGMLGGDTSPATVNKMLGLGGGQQPGGGASALDRLLAAAPTTNSGTVTDQPNLLDRLGQQSRSAPVQDADTALTRNLLLNGNNPPVGILGGAEVPPPSADPLAQLLAMGKNYVAPTTPTDRFTGTPAAQSTTSQPTSNVAVPASARPIGVQNAQAPVPPEVLARLIPQETQQRPAQPSADVLARLMAASGGAAGNAVAQQADPANYLQVGQGPNTRLVQRSATPMSDEEVTRRLLAGQTVDGHQLLNGTDVVYTADPAALARYNQKRADDLAIAEGKVPSMQRFAQQMFQGRGAIGPDEQAKLAVAYNQAIAPQEAAAKMAQDAQLERERLASQEKIAQINTGQHNTTAIKQIGFQTEQEGEQKGWTRDQIEAVKKQRIQAANLNSEGAPQPTDKQRELANQTTAFAQQLGDQMFEQKDGKPTTKLSIANVVSAIEGNRQQLQPGTLSGAVQRVASQVGGTQPLGQQLSSAIAERMMRANNRVGVHMPVGAQIKQNGFILRKVDNNYSAPGGGGTVELISPTGHVAKLNFSGWEGDIGQGLATGKAREAAKNELPALMDMLKATGELDNKNSGR